MGNVASQQPQATEPPPGATNDSTSAFATPQLTPPSWLNQQTPQGATQLALTHQGENEAETSPLRTQQRLTGETGETSQPRTQLRLIAGGDHTNEPTPHLPTDQLQNLIYSINDIPPWPEAILLGFQHYLVMLSSTVIIATTLVGLMEGGKEEKAEVVQTLLFVAGLNTLVQTTFGTRLPCVMGSCYAFGIPTMSIILAGRFDGVLDSTQRFKATMRAIQGATITASTVQIILGFSGLWTKVARLLSPLSVVPLISLVGFGLYELGFSGVAKCVEIGLPELVVLIFIVAYLSQITILGKRVFQLFPVLVSVSIVWLYAYLLTLGGAYTHAAPKTEASCRCDRAGLISGAPWVKVPYPFQWGLPTFHAGEAFAMMFASFVALVESTGAFIAVSRAAGATMIPPPVLSRGVGWQGVGILLSGLFGSGTVSSVSIENVGLLALTRVGSRRVVHISAAFMLFFSILGKFGAFFASIPPAIFAGLYCLFFAYVGSVGLNFLQFCNINSFRTMLIVGCSIFLGISIPQYFKEYQAINGFGPCHTSAGWFNDVVNIPFSSEPFVAAIVGTFLDNTLNRNDQTVRKDRGRHWWDKFQTLNGDTRSNEFYSLPFNLIQNLFHV